MEKSWKLVLFVVYCLKNYIVLIFIVLQQNMKISMHSLIIPNKMILKD